MAMGTGTSCFPVQVVIWRAFVERWSSIPRPWLCQGLFWEWWRGLLVGAFRKSDYHLLGCSIGCGSRLEEEVGSLAANNGWGVCQNFSNNGHGGSTTGGCEAEGWIEPSQPSRGRGGSPLDSHDTNHNNFVRHFFSRRSCLAFTPYESMDVKDVTVVAPCTQT